MSKKAKKATKATKKVAKKPIKKATTKPATTIRAAAPTIRAAAPPRAEPPAADVVAALDWSPDQRACTATWMALRTLQQSERPFPSSGTVRMDQLTFFNAAASDELRRLQAGTLAKELDNFLREIDGAVLKPGTNIALLLSAIRDMLITASKTMAELAGIVDAGYDFSLDA